MLNCFIHPRHSLCFWCGNPVSNAGAVPRFSPTTSVPPQSGGGKHPVSTQFLPLALLRIFHGLIALFTPVKRRLFTLSTMPIITPAFRNKLIYNKTYWWKVGGAQ